MIEKTAQALWQDYLFLTKEILKFLDRQDMEMFHELMEQRRQMQTVIEETPDNGFRNSPQGKELLSQIEKQNQVLLNHFQLTHRQVRRHHQVAEAYAGGNKSPVSRRDWSR